MSELQIDFAKQVSQFLLSILCGVITGLFYDVIKSFRIFFKFKEHTVFAVDLLFFMSAALFTYLFLLAWCGGEFRLYVVAGELMGFGLYRIILSKIVVKALLYVMKTVRKFLLPVIRVYGKFKAAIIKRLNKLLSYIKKHLKNIYKSLYNHKNNKKQRRGVENEQINGQHIT